VASPADVDRAIVVELGETENGHVTGLVWNRSAMPVAEVTLLIQQSYVWPDEFKPKGEDPSRAVVRHLQGPIPPGQSIRFDEMIPVPAVSRGTFETRAMVLGYRYLETGGGSEVPAQSGDPR
jgi:hypothetical protein